MIRLQRCGDCGAAQYPPREFCGRCLSDRMEWTTAEFLAGRVLARATLHHSNEPRFREHLPLTIGLVQLDAGPVVVCFIAATAAAGDAVNVQAGAEGLLGAAVTEAPGTMSPVITPPVTAPPVTTSPVTTPPVPTPPVIARSAATKQSRSC